MRLIYELPVLLTEQELRAALEPLLERLLVERFKLFQLQLDARLQSMMEAASRPAPAATDGHDENHQGLEQLLHAQDPNQVFESLFAESAKLVGTMRALLVRYQGMITVWRQEGLTLPRRFMVAEQSTVLPAGANRGTYPVRVRGQMVGLLHWQAAQAPAPGHLQRLELMLQAAGLVLLGWGLSPATGPQAQAPAGISPTSEPLNQAQAFAQVLAEDLELYLRLDRSAEVAEAQRLEDAWARFQPEVERCRRAYRERHPGQAEIAEVVFGAAMRRLQSRG